MKRAAIIYVEFADDHPNGLSYALAHAEASMVSELEHHNIKVFNIATVDNNSCLHETACELVAAFEKALYEAPADQQYL